MSEAEVINKARGVALNRIERAERNFKLAFFGAAIMEAFFIGGFLMLSDLSNRMHLLLLIATMAVYSIVALGLVALGSHINSAVLRILKAIELTESRSADNRR